MAELFPGGSQTPADRPTYAPPEGPPAVQAVRPSRVGGILLRLGLLILVAGGFVAAAAYDVTVERNRAIEDAKQQTRNLALTLEVDAAGTIRAADRAAAGAGSLLQGDATDPMTDADRIAAAFARQLRVGGAVGGLAIADSDGRILHSAGERLPTAIATSLAASMTPGSGTPGEAADGPTLSQPFRVAGGEGWRIAVARRNGEIGNGRSDESRSGFGVAILDLRRFDRLYALLDVGPYGLVTLWAPDGAILGRYPAHPAVSQDPYAHRALKPVLAETATVQTEMGRSPLDGEERISTTRALQGLPLAVSVRLGAGDYLADWRQHTLHRALQTGILAAVLAALWLLLERHLGRLEAASRALRDSDRLFQALFDSTFQIMGLLTPSGTIVALNRSACELAGEPPEALIGRLVWTVPAWTPNAQVSAQFRGSIEAAASGRFIRYETVVGSGPGRRVMDVSLKPIRDEAGIITLVVTEARDITQRKAFEEELQASERRLRSYLDAAMEGFFVSDRTGRFVDVNPAGCQLLGYTREEMMTMRVTGMIPPGHPLSAESLAGFRSVPKTGMFRGDAVLSRKDGGIVLVEVNAVRLEDDRFLGVIRDLTKRHRTEEALRASSGRLAALVSALPDHVFILDEELRYREVIANGNQGLLVMPQQSLFGRTIAEVLPADLAARMTEGLTRTLETGLPQQLEFSLSVPAGLRWFEARTQRLSTGFAARPMVLLLTRDVTDRVEAAQRLAGAKEQAESAHRAKSAFLATMSHELRTPLNAIIGFSEIMLHELFGPIGSPRYRDYARHIQVSGRHLLDLINDVLDMSKLEAGHYALEEAWIEVPELVDACAALAAVPAETSGVSLTVTAAPDLPMVLADERALRQIVLNVLSNAVKFTPGGGRVTVEAGLRDDGAFVLTVADTGIGIPEEAMARIMEPFQQADSSINRRFGGSGLGLSISRNLIELHGGDLKIASTEGEGTTVTLILPADRVGGHGARTVVQGTV